MLKTGITILVLGQNEELCAGEVNGGSDVERRRYFEAVAS